MTAEELIQQWIDLDEGVRSGASCGISCKTEFMCAAINELIEKNLVKGYPHDTKMEFIPDPDQFAGYPGAKETDLKLSKFDKLAKGYKTSKDPIPDTTKRDMDFNEPSTTGLSTASRTPY